jgi:predicted nucleic acid-binding Zn ribbon protein
VSNDEPDRSPSRRRAARPGTAGAGPTGPDSSGPDSSGADRTGAAGTAGPGPAGLDPAGGDLVGPELARAVVDAARSRRAAAQPRRRSPDEADGAATADGAKPRRRLRGYSGPGPDPRDPQPFGAVLERLVKARGWQKPAAEATVFGAWERVVGPDVAKHSRPVKLDGGELTVEAESTAWATQLRLLAGSLLKRIAAEVGHNVVTKLNIHGPAAPSWNRGPRRVRGRGPRDTYG